MIESGWSRVDGPSVVVVLPTYNEADNIERLAQAVLDLPCRPDILVVDDSSPDGTGELVLRMAEVFRDRVRLLTRPRREGLGRAYVAAFTRVIEEDRHDVLVQMDVDGSHRPDDVTRLVEALRDADLAIGSRYVPGGRVEGWPLHRQMLSRGGNVYARVLLHHGVRDLTGGFKAWRLPLLRRLDLSSVRSGGYAFQIETTHRALEAGAAVREVPITFRDRELGHSKMSSRIAREAVGTVLRLRLTSSGSPAPRPPKRDLGERLARQRRAPTSGARAVLDVAAARQRAGRPASRG